MAAATTEASRKPREGEMRLRRRRRDRRKRMKAAIEHETMRRPAKLNEGRCSEWPEWLRATRMLDEKGEQETE